MRYYLLSIFLLALIGCSKQEGMSGQDGSANVVASEKALVCASCHDPNVKTGLVDAPPLTGRSYDELVTAIKNVHEYHVTQPSLMHDFKSEDIDGIATYFSNVK